MVSSDVVAAPTYPRFAARRCDGRGPTRWFAPCSCDVVIVQNNLFSRNIFRVRKYGVQDELYTLSLATASHTHTHTHSLVFAFLFVLAGVWGWRSCSRSSTINVFLYYRFYRLSSDASEITCFWQMKNVGFASTHLGCFENEVSEDL